VAWQPCTSSSLPPTTPALSIRGAPAIADDGTVAFAGVSFGKASVIGFGDGVSMSTQAVGGALNSTIMALGICSAGDIVFVEGRPASAGFPPRLRHSHTRLDTRTTLLEAPIYSVCMSSNGTVAAYIDDHSSSAFYRGPAAGPLSVVQRMQGDFFNGHSFRYDVNDAGEVAAAINYMDSIPRQGVLVLSKPGAPLASLTAVLQRVRVAPTSVAINNRGQVAFTLNETVLVHYFTPPFPTPFSDVGPTSTQLLIPGVYVATPAPIGTPVRLDQIASRASYGLFGEVDINDEGTVVFRASLGTTRAPSGLFRGGNPLADLIVFDGEVLVIDGAPRVMTQPVSPQLNNGNQLAFLTGTAETGFSIWRVYLPPRV